MKIKKLLFWLLIGLIGFNVFGYVRMHTRGDVIAYKRFSKALMKGDAYQLRNASTENMYERPMKSQESRMELFDNKDIIFTYYRIRDRRVSEDGKIVNIVGEQISRVNVEGSSGNKMWGEREIKVRQLVTVVLQNNAWKVSDFSDPAMLQ